MMITNPDVEAVWKFSEGHGLHVTCRWLAAYRRIRLSLLVADSRRYERVGGPCVAQKVRDVAGGAIDVVVCFHLSLSLVPPPPPVRFSPPFPPRSNVGFSTRTFPNCSWPDERPGRCIKMEGEQQAETIQPSE